MNAHSWYSQTGAPTISPTQSAIFSRRMSWSATPRMMKLQTRSPAR